MNAKQRRKLKRDGGAHLSLVPLRRECESPVPVSSEEVTDRAIEVFTRRDRRAKYVGAAVGAGIIGGVIALLTVLM